MGARAVRASRTAAAMLAGALAACAHGPLVVPTQFPAQAPEPPTLCPAHLVELTDSRRSMDGGRMGRRPIDGSAFPQWIFTGFATLFDTPHADADALELHAELLQAYSRYVATTKSATLALRVEYRQSGIRKGSNIYRGTVAGSHWSGSEAEMLGAFERALRQVLRQVRADTDALCELAHSAPNPDRSAAAPN
ncbi:MAG TPA: hypothetical protein VM369_06525 [Candidatus Binatia bacterium]|nr:hypothetical protein [Candidatus Binatia bacterium]